MENYQKREYAMNSKTIRPATVQDLPRILEIYASARTFMAQNGNPTQWPSTYPPEDLLLEDMEAHSLFVITEEDRICGVFVFALGEDPTYRLIENGSWRSAAPYGVIHRIAGDGHGGIFNTALEFASQKVDHLRIDTHEDNKPMQHLVEKFGFSFRGIIYTDNGTPRLAYDWIKEN